MVLKDTNIGRLIMDEISIEKTANKKAVKKVCAADAKKISNGLAKVAEYPYSEGVYKSVQQMMKYASDCINDLTLSLESIEQDNAELEKAAEVRILIDEMVKNGHVDEFNAQDKVQELVGKSKNELSIVKEAMKMVNNRDGNNVFFELEKEAKMPKGKQGMFDIILG